MKMIQLTDTHLFADDHSDILQVKSNLTFKKVIAKTKAEDLYDADVIFLTGDISQDESDESYQKIADEISTFNLPVYWVAGNHDANVPMQTVFNRTKNFNCKTSLSTPNWHFIFLNTKQEGAIDGYLSTTELQILRDELTLTQNKKTAIVMHHHPAPVGTPFIDKYILRNRDEFWNVISNTNVALIICGHVHGDYHFKFNNVMIESSPATCLQWAKGSTELLIENKIGYKVYWFDERGYKAEGKLW